MSPERLVDPQVTGLAGPREDRAPGAGGVAPDPLDADRRVSILLVDDHHENLTALQAVLEPLGERLICAESGEQALRALLREEIALILLDVRMAEVDGLETARIIRARPATRHIPIIFLTAQASDVGEIALAYATGAVDYVIKPFEPEILRAKVSVFVELHRERSERVRQSQARAEAEAVARTIRTLQILSDTALAHLEVDALVAELLERTVTLFEARAAALLLRDESGHRLVAAGHHGAALPERLLAPVRIGTGELGRIAAARRPVLDQDDPPEPDGPGGNRAIVPLAAAGDVLGLLVLEARAQRPLQDSDLELLGLAADRMAIAIDHVQRFAQGRQVVETVQRNLLPNRLPHHPRLELAARYLPSGLAPQIGGDWYDAIELDADRTAVMMGDVVGHGVRAATTMSELRNALRAFAVEGHDPSAALVQLDRVAYATLGPGMVATVLFLIIDANTGTIAMARAGHPPPALRTADGRVRYLESEGRPPIGVQQPAGGGESAFSFEPGDTLLLYTDGLIERRSEAINAGLDRLSDALATAPAEVEAICDHILARTVGQEPSQDDTALLAVRFLPLDAGGLELTVPARPDSVPLVRHRLRAWLEHAVPQLPPEARGDLELACSEAASNAVRHAYGPAEAMFRVSVRADADAVELRISDRGRWRQPRSRHGGRGLSLIRVLVDELQIDQRATGTTVTMRVALPSARPAPGDAPD
jgi:serine phosphatase RsbU (regulator of sigma subunit)/DNA-binding response OmpR family regulator/anti-sigma regulatory factor (Ser/Thr protein kinase)